MKNLIEALKQIQKIASDALAEYDGETSGEEIAMEALKRYEKEWPCEQPMPNVEADEFECEFCQCVFDIEDSVKLPSGHLICAQCDADKIQLPKVGDRIRLIHAVDRYPFFIAKEGSYGTVVEVTDQISVKMDDHLESCKEWDNCVIWSLDHGNDGEPLAEIFAFDCEVLKVIPPQDLPVELVEGRLHDKEWPCGMRVRFKRPYGVGSGFVAEGTVATVVWWSPDNAAVKLDRLATMHGDGAVIEWEATHGKCIWDDVEEVTDLVIS